MGCRQWVPAGNRRFSLSSEDCRPRADCHFSSTTEVVHQVLKELTVLSIDLSHRSRTATIERVVVAKPPSNSVSTKVMPRQPRTLIEVNPRRIKQTRLICRIKTFVMMRRRSSIFLVTNESTNKPANEPERLTARSGATFRVKDTTRSDAAKPLIWIKLTPSLPPTLRHRFDLQANRSLSSRNRDCLAVCPRSCGLPDQVDRSRLGKRG